MNKKFHIPIFFLIISTFIACNSDETCRKSRIVNMSLHFYKDTINLKRDTVSLALSLDSITAYGLQNDSILYKKVRSKSSITLPLNQFAEKSQFVLKSNGIYDTLTVYYKNKNEYLSLECGAVRVHQIDSVSITKHFFHYTTITNKDVNTTTTSSNAENIKIHHFIK